MLPIAILYCKTYKSVYKEFLPHDWLWHKQRDARYYYGPHPVVAHPPCAAFCKLSHFALEDLERDSCAPIALAQVRAFGGVLEHPKDSKFFIKNGLPAVGGIDIDSDFSFSIEINQFDYMHPAKKPTWLFIHGTTPAAVRKLLAPERFDKDKTKFIFGSGNSTRIKKMPAHRILATTKWKTRTPRPLAEMLVAIAQLCRKKNPPTRHAFQAGLS